MRDKMTFPETWEEFEKSYGFDDSEEIYTNGSRLIPSFRVKQWLDHEESKRETKRQETISTDCIYRQQAIDAIRNIKAITGTSDDEILLIDKAQAQTELMMLPSAEPRKKGKWIDKSDDIDGAWNYCSVCMEQAIDLYDFCPNCGADMREGDSE